MAAPLAALLLSACALGGQVAPVAPVPTVASETVDVQLLAINDFHGALEPAAGPNGEVGFQDAGGMEYLATHLARLKATNPNTVVVSAGDNIGGTPLLSSLSHDEASIEALNLAGLQISTVGNHELDEGWWELARIATGGCHPVDGCQDGTPFAGAAFEYLAANISLDPQQADPRMVARAGVTGTAPRPLFPAFTIRDVGGVRIGFIGLILQGAPGVIAPASIRGLTFGPEAEAANEAAGQLRQQGVRAIVVLIHEGGTPASADINGCDRLSADFVDLVRRMSDDIDVVVSGHTHRAYNCTIGTKLVTSAASTGRIVTDIDLRLDRAGGAIISKSARNRVVTRDVEKHAAATALIASYRSVAGAIAGRVVGTFEASLFREPNEAGESPLGDVIADAMLEGAAAVPGGAAVVAFTNPGGIRGDIVRPAGGGHATATYAQLFAVQPFGNTVVVKTLTGAAIVDLLEEQFGLGRTRILQVSRGFTYAYDRSRPRGQRIDRASVRIAGMPLVLAERYRVATIDYLWAGGDGFTALASGTDPIVVGADVDVLADYFFRRSPVAPGPQNRIRRIR